MISGNILEISGRRFIVGLKWKKILNHGQLDDDLKKDRSCSGVVIQQTVKSKTVFQAGLINYSGSSLPSLAAYVSALYGDNIVFVHETRRDGGGLVYWVYASINGVLLSGSDKILEAGEAIRWVRNLLGLASLTVYLPDNLKDEFQDVSVKNAALDDSLAQSSGLKILKGSGINVKSYKALNYKYIFIFLFFLAASAGLFFFMQPDEPEVLQPTKNQMSPEEKAKIMKDFLLREKKAITDGLGSIGFLSMNGLYKQSQEKIPLVSGWQVTTVVANIKKRSIEYKLMSRGGKGLIEELLRFFPAASLDKQRLNAIYSVPFRHVSANDSMVTEDMLLQGEKVEYSLIDAVRFAGAQMKPVLAGGASSSSRAGAKGGDAGYPQHRVTMVDLMQLPPEVGFKPTFYKAEYNLSGVGLISFYKLLDRLLGVVGAKPTILEYSLKRGVLSSWNMGVIIYVR